MKTKRKYTLVFSISAILIALIVWIIVSNASPMIQEFTIASSALPENFSGYKIAQVSDLHNAEFEAENRKLLALLAGSKADIIVITGDLIDSRRTNLSISLEFVKKATKLAPVYFVTGNHEARIAGYKELEAGLLECGVTVLRNETVRLEVDEQAIQLMGIDDPSFTKTDGRGSMQATIVNNALRQQFASVEGYTILLSHRPELFDVYVSNGVNLIFSGHAHGGQFRIPFVGGLLAPNQGLFPRYDSGLYTKNGTNMLVSRGLGNSLFAFRVNNRPELVVATLIKS